MAEFLLVHGSCHGAWCWRDVIPALAALGHSARAIDLPSHGDDETPPETVTLDLYADAVIAAIAPDTILVGHSMAGYPITAAALKAPDRIKALVYLCAYVPIAGKTLAEMRAMAPSQPLLEAVQVAPDRVTFTIDPAQAVAKFYHDVDPATADWARAQLCAQPILPQETALAQVATGLPRHYIRCRDDRTIPPLFQDVMTKDWHGGRVIDMATSHSPFLSDPTALAAHLDALAQETLAT